MSPRHPAISSLLSGSAFLSSSAGLWPAARPSLNVPRRAGRDSAPTHYRSCRRSAGGEHWPLFWDPDREFKLKREDGGERARWKNEIPDKDVCVKPPLAPCPAGNDELCSLQHGLPSFKMLRNGLDVAQFPLYTPENCGFAPCWVFPVPRAESGPWVQWPSGFCQWFLIALLQGWN